MKEKIQTRGKHEMNIRKSKLFQREKMQPLKPRDYIKVAAIAGVIVIPLLFGLII